ncbi:hypothetical protein SRHO_G00125710 [Serrasalmus rhombeus]
MIRTEQEEFFIEPVETGQHVIEQEDGGDGRPHIVYRSAAVKKPPASSLTADFHARAKVTGLSKFDFILEDCQRRCGWPWCTMAAFITSVPETAFTQEHENNLNIGHCVV